jgi:membrane associated rhomboid family serine protease
MRHDLGFSSPTYQVSVFLIVIIATYLFFALFGNTYFGHVLYGLLVLNPSQTVYSFEIWRLLTYGFLHDSSSPMHVIFNALLLYLMGPPLEDYYGEAKFFLLIMLSIISGGILVCVAFLLGISHAPVLGFSGATMGLVIAWGLTFRTATIYIFGIIPLTGMQLVYITVGMEVLYAASSDFISSAAHFGGILAGFLFTKLPSIQTWLKKLNR